MPASKVCTRIEKTNPEVCGVRYPVKVAGADSEKKLTPEELTASYQKMKVKELRRVLNDRGVECKGCTEKKEFVKKVIDTMHLERSEEL